MIKIISDSSCDLKTLSVLEADNTEFLTVPMKMYTDDFCYEDDEKLDVSEMLKAFENSKSRSYTSCPDSDSWLKAFEGADEIYVVTLTSALSGTYNSATLAKKIYEEEHPKVKIAVFDSRTTGPELYMLAEKIAELVNQKKSFEEICDTIEAYSKKTRLFFSLASVQNLAKNGRINKVLATAIGALGIRILCTATLEGTIEMIEKGRGEKRVVRQMIQTMKKAGYTGGKIRICHIESEKLAKQIIEAIKSEFPNIDASVYPASGLCSYYAERGGIILGCEC